MARSDSHSRLRLTMPGGRKLPPNALQIASHSTFYFNAGVKRSPRLLLTAAALVVSFSADSRQGCRADIQDPPYLDHGPIRKLSRGIANLALGSTDLLVTLDSKNQIHGNSGMVYGLFSGLGRTLMRIGAGFYEVVTFPAPTTRKSYAPVLPSVVPWVQGGFEEFPPELGFESRFSYNRSGGATTRMP